MTKCAYCDRHVGDYHRLSCPIRGGNPIVTKYQASLATDDVRLYREQRKGRLAKAT